MKRHGKSRGLIRGKQSLTNKGTPKREHENRGEDNSRK